MLVVDGNTSFAKYEAALRSLPYEFWQTNNPKKAMEMTANRLPDLLLTALDFGDYYKTQIDGPELIRRMHGTNQRMKFILCSGYQESQVQPTLDELRGTGIDVRHIRFEDAPNNLDALIQSLIQE